jgi:hypothetical protein
VTSVRAAHRRAYAKGPQPWSAEPETSPIIDRPFSDLFASAAVVRCLVRRPTRTTLLEKQNVDATARVHREYLLARFLCTSRYAITTAL